MKPARVEQVALKDLQRRITQLGGRLVPEKSNAQRHVYWSEKNEVWLMVSARGGVATIGFYQMTRCPCEDE